MEKTSHLGMNRTGVDMSPMHSKAMLEGAERVPGDVEANQMLATRRQEMIMEAGTIGSVPMPGTLKGALSSVMKKATGKSPETFINKLGERLAFERMGVRLYEALITKCETLANQQVGAVFTIDDLRRIRADEARHFQLVHDAITSIGADPTAQTPDADVSAVLSSGVLKVITDIRTTVPQSLEAILTAELADTAAWELLVQMAETMGMSDMAVSFREALEQEERHILQVKQWYTQLMTFEAGGKTTRH